MSAALSIALILASLAIVVLVACVVPIAFQARRRLQQLALSAEQLNANVEGLVRDTDEMVKTVNALAKRASRRMDDVDQVVHTVRKWTDGVDPVLEAVGSTIVLPVFSWAQTVNRYRTGAVAFLQSLFRGNHHNNDIEQETNHVRN